MEWPGVRGRRVVITGATNGIGLAAAEALAALGAQLTIVGRDQQRTEAAAVQIRAAGEQGAVVDVMLADLVSQAAVRELAERILADYPKVDVLINNAGAIFAQRELTSDGVEKTWALNHLAPFLLTSLLLDRLRESAPARVITTSSRAHVGAQIPLDDLNAERSYAAVGFGRYGQSKLANILFTAELARRLEGTGVEAFCFHPGVVASGFNMGNGRLMRIAMMLVRPFSRSPRQGADTLVWLAESPDASGQSGGYFVDRRRVEPSAAARDMETARRLWEVSEEQVAARGAGQ